MSNLKVGTFAAAMIGLSLGQASATTYTSQPDDIGVVGPISGVYETTSSSAPISLTPGVTVGFGDILSPAPSSYSDDYYLTSAVNATLSIFGFTGSSTNFKLVAEDSTPTQVGSASFVSGQTVGALNFDVTLLAGTTYELIVSGNPTVNPASYAGNFVTSTPLPAGLPLIAGGLGLVGWLSSRSRKQNVEGKANFIAA